MNRTYTRDIVAAAVMAGVSYLLSGKALLTAPTLELLGSLASQTVDPCFNGFDWSQAGAAALLGGTGGVGNLIPKTAGNNAAYIGREAVTQSSNNKIAGSF
jgi:hypothetical protein